MKALKYSIIFIILFFIIFFGFGAFKVGATYREVVKGGQVAEEGLRAISNQDFNKATFLFQDANQYFSKALKNIKLVRRVFFLEQFDSLKYQVKDFEYLLSSAVILSSSMEKGGNFINGLESFIKKDEKKNFSEFSKEEKRKILEYIKESYPDLSKIEQDLIIVSDNLKNLSYKGVVGKYEKELKSLENKIESSRKILEIAVPVAGIMPLAGGYPEKQTYLVLFQNSDELRPTGGFLGTYGILELEYGDILRFDTHDIYHLDMPVKDMLEVIPPEPLKKYLGVEKWFMRDANWSPDWPTAAQQISWFYEKENSLLPEKDNINNFSGQFDGVIAVTPELVKDFLAITGPVYIEDEEYDENNFTELLQYKVEKGYQKLGVPSWHRKEVIGEVLKEVKIELLNLPFKEYNKLFAVLKNNLANKNILLFFKDESIEEYAKSKNWAGEVKETKDDYFMVIDANMAALKTDAVIDRKIKYDITEEDGRVLAELNIDYNHTGGFDWKTTRYRTYTRIYVPKGSKLIRAAGFSEGTIDVDEELDKTVFGGFLSVEPGEKGNLYFEYELPTRIKESIDSSKYNLYAEKQPGVKIENIVFNFEFLNKIKDINQSEIDIQKTNKINWVSDFFEDKNIEIKF